MLGEEERKGQTLAVPPANGGSLLSRHWGCFVSCRIAVLSEIILQHNALQLYVTYIQVLSEQCYVFFPPSFAEISNGINSALQLSLEIPNAFLNPSLCIGETEAHRCYLSLRACTGGPCFKALSCYAFFSPLCPENSSGFCTLGDGKWWLPVTWCLRHMRTDAIFTVLLWVWHRGNEMSNVRIWPLTLNLAYRHVCRLVSSFPL